jgi:hypothetical protein
MIVDAFHPCVSQILQKQSKTLRDYQVIDGYWLVGDSAFPSFENLNSVTGWPWPVNFQLADQAHNFATIHGGPSLGAS